MIRVAIVAVVAALVAADAFAAGAGAPTVTGPLTLSDIRGGGCQAASGCAFDYLLARSATSTPRDTWHAYWVTTATNPVQRGWCELDAIANLTWGTVGAAGILPAKTYPPTATSVVGPQIAASLVVDAGGRAATTGHLRGPGMPSGLVTVWVHRGYLTELWQGRTSFEPSLVMAAEVENPTGASPSPPGRANDYNIGLPCADVAPPGETFLARFARATIHQGQNAYLELRIPDTGQRWIITPKLDEQTTVEGTATVQLIGGLGEFKTTGKPEVLRFADRYTYETKPGFGAWVAIVTLHGPTGYTPLPGAPHGQSLTCPSPTDPVPKSAESPRICDPAGALLHPSSVVGESPPRESLAAPGERWPFRPLPSVAYQFWFASWLRVTRPRRTLVRIWSAVAVQTNPGAVWFGPRHDRERPQAPLVSRPQPPRKHRESPSATHRAPRR